MGYFEQYLKDDSKQEQYDISVQCDVKIFEWLIKYVDYLQNFADYGILTNLYRSNFQIIDGDKIYSNNYLSNYKPPQLEVKTCVSILISADFLVMK
jgi:hypothetical protein